MFTNTFGRFENVECGLVHYTGRSRNLSGGSGFGSGRRNSENEHESRQIIGVPLKSVSVEATVVHAITKVELIQVYQNTFTDLEGSGSGLLEVLYYFPIDVNGGVTHFHAELDGQIIKGVIKSKKDALAEYDRAIGQRQTDFSLASNKPFTFKVRIGLLRPGREVKIVIHYVTEAKNIRGTNAIGFSIPSTLVPRYVFASGAEHPPGALSVIVNVEIQGKIKSIISNTHEIEAEPKFVRKSRNWTSTVVKLVGNSTDDMLERDFELQIIPEGIHEPRIYAERMGNSTALMTHLIPRFRAPKQNVELIFVLDRSGSMMEFAIDLAKRALTLFLHSLPVDCYFNIVGFGYNFEFLFADSRKYNEESLRHAITYVQGLSADLGGTEILAPLVEIYNQDIIRGYNRQIFVLTDGAVDNTDQVIDLCRSNAKNTRVFSLGIGPGFSRPLVEGIAEAAGGTATFVVNNENFDSEVLQHLANAVEHSLTNIQLKWIGIPEDSFSRPTSPTRSISTIGNRVKSIVGQILEPIGRLSPTPPAFFQDKENEFTTTCTQIPESMGPIFDGQQMVVFGLFGNHQVPTGVEIEADSPDGPVVYHIEVPAENERGSVELVHELTAIKAIRQLEAKETELSRKDNEKETLKERETIRKDIVNLSCKHGLVSKYTAYVAICSGSGDENWVVQDSGENKYAHGRWLLGKETYSYVSDDQYRAKGDVFITSSPNQNQLYRSKSYSPKPGFSISNIFAKTPSPTRELPEFELRSPEQHALALASSPSASPAPAPAPPLRKGKLIERNFNIQNIRTASSSASGRKTKTKGEDYLHAIVDTQSYNGSFHLSSEFCDAIGKSGYILVEESINRGWNEQAWATALALTYLKEKLGHLRASWDLVAEKASIWLQMNLRNDVDAILIAAHDFLNSGTSI